MEDRVRGVADDWKMGYCCYMHGGRGERERCS